MNGFKRSNGKFLVDTENVDFIIENIRAKVDDRSFAIPMERKKVTRIIYRMPYLKENESRWLRILIGDVDCHNKTGVTITYKVKNTTEGKEVKTPILKVEEFDQAVDFFEALGFQRTSTQENICRLPRYLTKPRQRRSEWDMAGSDGISRVSAVFRGKSLLTNKMRII